MPKFSTHLYILRCFYDTRGKNCIQLDLTYGTSPLTRAVFEAHHKRMKRFLDGRELEIVSPHEGFYIREYRRNGKRAQIWEVHSGTRIENRADPHSYLAVMVSGEIEFQIGNDKKNLFPTDFVEIPANETYTFKTIGKKTARMVLFCLDE